MSTYFSDKITAYGTAVSCGVFIGAALSAGTILGGLTWYVASRNVLDKMIDKFSDVILPNLIINEDNSKDKKARASDHVDSNGGDTVNVLQLKFRVQKLEERINDLETQRSTV